MGYGRSSSSSVPRTIYEPSNSWAACAVHVVHLRPLREWFHRHGHIEDTMTIKMPPPASLLARCPNLPSVSWPHMLMLRVGLAQFHDQKTSPFSNPSRFSSFFEVARHNLQALAYHYGHKAIELSHQTGENDSCSLVGDSVVPSFSVECWTLELVEINQATLHYSR